MTKSHHSEFELGILLGILVGEGHFGGDGRQPQITLRMHTRHESLFRWIDAHFPGGRLYGPYHHGGRSYFQWMARGEFLREKLVPILARRLSTEIDTPARQRFDEMCLRYGLGRSSRGGADALTPSTRGRASGSRRRRSR